MARQPCEPALPGARRGLSPSARIPEQPAGAFLIFPRATWQALQGFDERFHPLWFEDVDFLCRAYRAGYRIRYEPEARAVSFPVPTSIKNLQLSERQRLVW
jgi:hypothetical protein